MLLLIILEWLVVVFSLRIAVFGNPILILLARADPALVDRVDALTTTPEPSGPPAVEDILFLRSFSRHSLIQLAMLVLEVGLLIYLVATGTLPVLCLVLLGKNLAMLAFSFYLAQIHKGPGLFAALLRLPRWTRWADRFSAFVSGTGFLVLFLAANQLLPELH